MIMVMTMMIAIITSPTLTVTSTDDTSRVAGPRHVDIVFPPVAELRS